MSKPSQICFIGPQVYQIFSPQKEENVKFGGAEVQISLLAQETRLQGREVHIMSYDYGQKNHENLEGIHFWKSSLRNRNIIFKTFKFFYTFEKIPSNIYIQRSLTPISGILSLYSKLTRKTFIYMVSHDRETDGTHEVYQNWLTALLVKINFKFSDYIITQNTYQQNQLAQRRITSHLLPSSIDLSNVSSSPSFNSYILWVGRSEPWKRPHLFLDLAEKIPHLSFTMICPPAKNHFDLHRDVERRAYHLSNVSFISFVPYSDIEDYFKKATIFVNTSTKEGVPNTFIQSMKHSTPILSFRVNPDSMITDYNVGFLSDDSLEISKYFILQAYKNSDIISSKASSCYQYVNEFHNVKKNTEKLLQFIE